MVTRPMRATFVALASLTCAVQAMAAERNLSPKAWFNEVLQQGPISCECPRQLMFVKGVAGGKPDVWQINSEKFQKDAFWEIVDKEELTFSRKMNQSPGTDNPYPEHSDDKNATFSEIFNASFVDSIVFSPEFEERWSMVRNDASGPQKVFTVKKPADTSPEGIRAWLLDKLGYKGFLIDQRDQFVLVATYAPVASSANALLLTGSAKQLRVKRDDAQGGALLKLVSCDEAICIFEKLIDSEKESMRGEKIVF